VAELQEVTRTVIGRPAHVRNVLVNAERRGRLVSAAPAVRVARGAVRVDVVLLEPRTSAHAEPRTRVRPAESNAEPFSVNPRYIRVGVAITAATAVLGLLAYLVAVIVEWIAAHAALLTGGAVMVLAVAGVAVRGLRSVGVCVGLHCEGCGHR
jgi:hypothetical protein